VSKDAEVFVEGYPPDSARDPVFWQSLSDEGVDACARLFPAFALAHATCRMAAERLDWCALRAPEEALRVAWRRLTPACFEELARIVPLSVAQYAAGRLSRQQAEDVAARDSHAAVSFLSAHVSHETLERCASASPVSALCSEATRAVLQGRVLDAIARRVWERGGRLGSAAVVAVLEGAPHVVTDTELAYFVAGESDQARTMGGPSARWRAVLLRCSARLCPHDLERAVQFHPSHALWYGIEHLPAAALESALSLANPDAIEDAGADIPIWRRSQVERLAPELRKHLLVHASATPSAGSMS